MRKLTFLAAASLAVVSLFSACKKDEDKPADVTGAARMTTLTAKDWLVTGYTLNGANAFNSFFEACERDDVYKFTAAKKYIELTGATKCAGETTDTVDQSTFSFNADYSKLIIDGDTATVKSFNENSFSLESTGLGLTAVETFTKK